MSKPNEITQAQINLIDYFLASAEALGFGSTKNFDTITCDEDCYDLLHEFLPQFYVEFADYLERPLPKGFQSAKIIHKEDVE